MRALALKIQPDILRAIKRFFNDCVSGGDGKSIYDLITHEFTHYFDDAKIKELTKVRERVDKFFEKYRSWTGSSSYFVIQLRDEGLARFYEYKKKEFFLYDKKKIYDTKEYIHEYHGALLMVDTYECGFYMWYTIALAYLFSKDRDRFNEMKAYYTGKDFLFFAEGLRSIFSKNSIYIQNLSNNIILDILKMAKKWSHLKFLKEYKKACEILDVPKDQIIITIDEYNQMKKIDYDRWLSEIRGAGFPTKGLKSE